MNVAIYAVHGQRGATDEQALARLRFVAQGFRRAGLIFGPLWLLAQGLWGQLLLWLAVAAALTAAFLHGSLSLGAVAALYGLSAVLIGVEGAACIGAALERRGLHLLDIATGANEEAAARRFLDRAPVAAAPRAPETKSHSDSHLSGHIIGLFPEADVAP